MPRKFTFAGKLSFDEYHECHKGLAHKRRLWLRSLITIAGLALIVYGLLFSQTRRPDLVWIIPGVIWILYAAFVSPWQFRIRVRRNWNRYPAAHHDTEITVDAEGLTTSDDKGNPVFAAWDNFIGFKESDSLFLLYLSPLLPKLLPKRMLREGSVDEFRQFLNSVFPG